MRYSPTGVPGRSACSSITTSSVGSLTGAGRRRFLLGGVTSTARQVYVGYACRVQCPYCSGDSSVTETRVTTDGMRRRRLCTVCKRRFTTYEKVAAPSLKVVKRDGTTEPFDGDK